MFHATYDQRCWPFLRRYSNDPAAHTALGFFLLARDHNNNNHSSSRSRNDDGSDNDLSVLGDLESATAAFRRAIRASRYENSTFVPATRGLAVAVRRRRLTTPTATGDASRINDDGESEQVGEFAAWKSVLHCMSWFGVVCHWLALANHSLNTLFSA